ncbi:MAG: 2-C-methyl-D-erythritol 2,4-cyclodiphosphate synthase [Lachnospiraceae bacterium]|jgi:2-C-methyl-D-erythritol 2,4-cyclodiphosphate synthase|nr:2-C-methyl-D-erythritol 2,4-cyclodiphosphate synthase [Lachnospiraceae bacterium]
MRVGQGYDVHRLVMGRSLIIGGVDIPFSMGLLGHSDADVLVHAIMDALLGAATLGDIGTHFPDMEEKYKGISSLLLLEKVAEMLENKLFFVENIDAVIIAEAPKMRPFIHDIRTNIATALGITIDQVNIKATSEEGLGFTGIGAGIAAQAICLLTTPVNDGRTGMNEDRKGTNEDETEASASYCPRMIERKAVTGVICGRCPCLSKTEPE